MAQSLTNGAGEKDIQLFPNPVKGSTFYIVIPGLQPGGQATVTVRDIGGKVLMTTQLTGSGPIQHHLPSGVYFVTILSGRMNTTKKLVVE
jgi:hypothetical protein